MHGSFLVTMHFFTIESVIVMSRKYELTPELRRKIDKKKLARKRQLRKRMVVFSIFFVVLFAGILYKLNVLPQKYYYNSDFNIKTYKSQIDMDKDGVDDQSDILFGVRDYIDDKPKYKSVYYAGGYPTDEYGVCTDVVAQGFLHAGYDLMELVNQDILAHPEDYDIDKPDINIDFRRVRNLYVYFQHTAVSLTTDVSKIEEWQGGDVVVFQNHIGIVSDRRNYKGISYVIHHGSPNQIGYEQDILEGRDDIIGHFRIN